jgi:hypothetical protein
MFAVSIRIRRIRRPSTITTTDSKIGALADTLDCPEVPRITGLGLLYVVARNLYGLYSIGCAIVWAVILTLVSVKYPDRLHTYLSGWRRLADRMDIGDDCHVGLSAAKTEASRDVGPARHPRRERRRCDPSREQRSPNSHDPLSVCRYRESQHCEYPRPAGRPSRRRQTARRV